MALQYNPQMDPLYISGGLTMSDTRMFAQSKQKETKMSELQLTTDEAKGLLDLWGDIPWEFMQELTEDQSMVLSDLQDALWPDDSGHLGVVDSEAVALLLRLVHLPHLGLVGTNTKRAQLDVMRKRIKEVRS